MTQGEILSAIAHIDTLVEICRERSYDSMPLSHLDAPMKPFVTKAQEVAEKLSSFALENYDSDDESKRDLSAIICKQFLWHESFVFNDDLRYKDQFGAELNYSIMNIKRILLNTFSAYEAWTTEPVDADKSSAASDEEVEKLTTENERLQAELADAQAKIKELEDIKELQETSLDGIEADSKVGLTLLMKLMENDGADFKKNKNKTIAAKALKMITGRSESACKQIFSGPLSTTYHKTKIDELNGYLKTLGMGTLI